MNPDSNKHITIGVAGHVDHGKTELVKCLTGIDTDRMKEEKRRNISIESGIAPLVLPSGRSTAIVDVPGHIDFLKNTVRGLSGVDMAILVVAADDAVMPQTTEHLSILTFLGVEQGIVVLTKTDLVDEETRELAVLEIEELVAGSFLEGAPLLTFSAINRNGLEAIRNALDTATEMVQEKSIEEIFRLPIDQIRSFSGVGTVVSGTALSGAVETGMDLELSPLGLKTRVRSLEVHGRKAEKAFAGQRIGINLPRIPYNQLKRGMVLTHPGSISPAYLFNGSFCLLEQAPMLKNRQKIKIFLGTAVICGTIVMMGRDGMHPGESGLIQIRLDQKIPMLPNDPFVASLMNVQRVIGGGTVLEITRSKYRESKSGKIIPYLKSIQEKNITGIVDGILSINPDHAVNPEKLSRNTGIPIDNFASEIQSRISDGQLIRIRGYGIFDKGKYNQHKLLVQKTIEDVLKSDPLKENVKTGEIVDKLPRFIESDLVRHILDELTGAGTLVGHKGGYRMVEMAVSLSESQQELVSFLLDFAQDANIVPFSPHAAWKKLRNACSLNQVEKLLDYLFRHDQLIRLNNRRFLSLQGMKEIKSRVGKAIQQKGCIHITESNDILGYGRSISIPVFEYLDAIGFTCRQKDLRVLKAPHVSLEIQ